MLFNSYQFILFFLPLVLLLFYILRRFGKRSIVIAELAAASLFFYGWWNAAYLWVILASICGNYLFGRCLKAEMGRTWKKRVLFIGISTNLGAIGYFKYSNFFLGSVDAVLDTGWQLAPVTLPLAISFFTFQQIAYLVDTYKGKTQPHSFLEYGLFVTFFPQLIAGPIVRHHQVLPQFRHIDQKSPGIDRVCKHFSIGLTLFVIGLFKKVVLADGFALYATPVFETADFGGTLTCLAAWKGALGYTLQLYFDFSGYSDMAIGLARMFGIVLPTNFNSPYKSLNLIEFWQRWHITLSLFLRDYLYVPLGGGRKGVGYRYRNIMITMLLCGLWHGAGWNFVIWGGLHGLLIVANHQWRNFRQNALHHNLENKSYPGIILSAAFTFVLVVFGWVLFRAETLPGALRMITAMVGHDFRMAGAALTISPSWQPIVSALKEIDIVPAGALNLFSDQIFPLIALSVGLIICWALPSSGQIAEKIENLDLSRKGFYLLALSVGLLIFITALSYVDPKETPFLYFQF